MFLRALANLFNRVPKKDYLSDWMNDLMVVSRESQELPILLSVKAREQKRESLRRPYEPDPGFWVKFRDEKFHGDANTVAIAGREDDNRCVFAFPGEIKSLQSYPDGVRVLDGFGDTYFIYPTSEEITSCWIRCMDEQEMHQRDHQWREFYERSEV